MCADKQKQDALLVGFEKGIELIKKYLKETMRYRKMSNVNICKVVFGCMRKIPLGDTTAKMTYMRIEFKGE